MTPMALMQAGLAIRQPWRRKDEKAAIQTLSPDPSTGPRQP
jgi:hypothetical protein